MDGDRHRWTVTVTASVPESLNLEKDVPDAAFRAVLKKFDTDNDGIVSRAEADAVTELIYEEWNGTIIDLTGIAFFTNLETLSVQGELLESVDLSKNTKLKRINLEFNFIKSLDLSNQIHLIESETSESGSATYYGLQVGYQNENKNDGNASITVTLPSSKKSFWEKTWSKNKTNGSPVNKGVSVTFR